MKILLINKFYFRQGGAETHFFALKKLLEDKGHEVIVFSVADPRNEKTIYEKYFVSNVDFGRLRYNPFYAAKILGRMVYSFEARKKIKKLIKETRPDIAHLHNIYHHISPSILGVLKKNGIPIVMTLHDYKLICPSYNLFTGGDVCERCKKYKYCQAVRHSCLKGSKIASLFAAIEMWLHRLFGFYERGVDLFISPSGFLKNKILEWNNGLKIEVINNFVAACSRSVEIADKNYILYFGRLSKEKGVDLLVDAFLKLNYDIKLHVAGDGPEKASLEKIASGSQKIVFLGKLKKEEVEKEIGGSYFVVSPSRSYENFSLSVIEAFKCGRAVLAADTGGMSEIVENGVNGLLFERNSSADLLEKLKLMLADDDRIGRLGENGRGMVEEKLSEEVFYQKIVAVYEKVLADNN